MKILSDTLEPLVEEWDDPGDYPNAVASGPLPSYKYLAGIEGELKLELTHEENNDLFETIEAESLDFWVREVLDYRLPNGVASAQWHIISVEGKLGSNAVVTLGVLDVEADPDYDPGDYDDYDYD